MTNSEDTDVIFVPLSLSFSFINPRHSFPPLRCLSSAVPAVQHFMMRSYSDSHLFLKLATAAAVGADDEDRTSWYSGGELWDMDYVQHWLRLDETRTAIQQRMEYDAAELEDWSMDEVASVDGWKTRSAAVTDGKQQSLPCIEEDDSTTVGDDFKDDVTFPAVATTADRMSGGAPLSWHHFHVRGGGHDCGGSGSPGADSWSSADEYAAADTPPSKRSSVCYSADSIELLPPPGPIAGTDFTRDFYRLVKFESSKSLASTSSRSVGGACCEHQNRPDAAQPDREQALQTVLDFIAEQQQYCLSRQAEDRAEPTVATTVSPAVSPAAADPLASSSDRCRGTGPQQACDSNSCSDSNNLLNSKDSGLCGSDVEIECLPEDCGGGDDGTSRSPQHSVGAGRAVITPPLGTVPEEDEECASAKSTSPQPTSSTGYGGASSSVGTAETVMAAWPLGTTTSKDFIDQLNRMAGSGAHHYASPDGVVSPHRLRSPQTDDLDEACCCPTGWVHVEREIDFADPKVRFYFSFYLVTSMSDGQQKLVLYALDFWFRAPRLLPRTARAVFA